MNHERDREAEIIAGMVKRFRERVAAGPPNFDEVYDKLIAQEEELTAESHPFARSWRYLIDEFKRRRGLQVSAAIACVKVWASTARSRVETITIASSETLAGGFSSFLVATTITLGAIVPAALPAFASAGVGHVRAAIPTVRAETARSRADLASLAHVTPGQPASVVALTTGAGPAASADAGIARAPDQIAVGGETTIDAAGKTLTIPLLRLTANCNPNSQVQRTSCAVLRALPSLGLIH